MDEGAEVGIVDGPDGLTPGWITAALQRAGHDLRVADVVLERIGTGQMGATYRLDLTWDGPAGPSSLVAKIGADDPAARALVAPGYAAEVGFYTELASTVTVRTPSCWYGQISDDASTFTLLLDDVADCAPGVQTDGCTVEQARAAVMNLVGLHAPCWSDGSLWERRFLMRPSPEMAKGMGQAFQSAAETFVERYREQLDPDVTATLRAVSDAIVPWGLSGLEPFSLVHGDYRLDNLLFPSEGEGVVAVDWQTAAIGPPLRDVAYLLGTSLEPDDRRAHEEAMVAGYHEGLVDHGVTGYAAEQCWDDYRLGLLQGPLISIIGCIYATGVRSEASDAMFLSIVRRSCVAIDELRSVDLISS